MEENELYEQLERITELLSGISEQLEESNTILRNILTDMNNKQSSSQSESMVQDSRKIRKISLDSLNLQNISERSALFIGYNHKEFLNFIGNVVSSHRVHFKYAKGVRSPGELSAILNGLSAGDVVLFELEDILRIPEGLSILVETIENDSITVNIGKGATARSVRFDLPEVCVYLYTYDFLIPKKLENCLATIYVNDKEV